MNYDIENALNRLLSIADRVEASATRSGKTIEFKNIIIEDIFSFVSGITKHDSVARIRFLNEMYLKGKYGFLIRKQYESFQPHSLSLMEKIDSAVPKGVKLTDS